MPPSITSPEADDLGRREPGRPPRPRCRPDKIAAEWEETAERFRDEILERGVRDGIFRQHYDTDALDASLLLIPLLRFLPPEDPRICVTVEAIADQLTEHGLVLRYKVHETDDGLSGKEEPS